MLDTTIAAYYNLTLNKCVNKPATAGNKRFQRLLNPHLQFLLYIHTLIVQSE